MERSPNILMISMDEIQTECLSVYGNALIQTPNLDRLAKQGTVFNQAYCNHAVCMPARACMLTGRYPWTNKVRNNDFVLPLDEITLPQVLADNGYETAAIGKMHFHPLYTPYGFKQMTLVEEGRAKRAGVEDDYERFLARVSPEHLPYYREEEPIPDELGQFRDVYTSPYPLDIHFETFITNETSRFLGQRKENDPPFFVWTSYTGPHHPFAPPKPYDTMYRPEDISLPRTFHDNFEGKTVSKLVDHVISGLGITEDQMRILTAYYYGFITFLDHQIGRILQTLEKNKLLDSTIILFTGDHGELLGAHGRLYKGSSLFEQSIRIPLIIRYPSTVHKDVRAEGLAQQIDLMPTLLDMAEIEVPRGVQGKSLKSVLTGQSDAVNQYTLTSFRHEMANINGKALRYKNWKLIYVTQISSGELYDLENDPDEMMNLYYSSEHRDIRERMLELMVDALMSNEDMKLEQLNFTWSREKKVAVYEGQQERFNKIINEVQRIREEGDHI